MIDIKRSKIVKYHRPFKEIYMKNLFNLSFYARKIGVSNYGRDMDSDTPTKQTRVQY